LESTGIELQKSAREIITCGNVDWGYSEMGKRDIDKGTSDKCRNRKTRMVINTSTRRMEVRGSGTMIKQQIHKHRMP
jgi:hypothetical protein